MANENSSLLSLEGSPSLTTTTPVSKGTLLHLLTIFSCVTVVWLVAIFLIQLFLAGISILRADGNLISLLHQGLNESHPSFPLVIETGVRLYLVVFCVIAVLIELEITSAARSSSLCQSWEYRGLGFVFLGLLHAYTYLDEDFDSPIILRLLDGTAYSLIASGLVYVALGLANAKRIRDEKMARYIQLITFMEVSPHLLFSLFKPHIESG
jgi:hypothetical protein